ncbi:MAG: hypothetical protein AB8B51_19600 [Sedimentitalea sp.]
MTTHSRANLVLGLSCVAFAAATALIWVPLDTTTGLIETVRRRTSIGDALAPTIGAAFIGLGGLLVLREARANHQPTLNRANLAYVAALLGLLIGVFAIMRWAGPLAVLLSGEDTPYRALRDTAPWKWIGFGLGGTVLITTLISTVERRLNLRAVIIALCTVTALIAIFDLPFDDLLLPPNGDV